jgi:endonuclease-3
MPHANAIQILIRKGRRLFDAPRKLLEFTDDEHANSLLNDLETFPHAYVIGCVMDRQVRAGRAWIIPYRFQQKLGGFEFPRLRKLSLSRVRSLMSRPEPLHRFVDEMSRNLHEAIDLIDKKYQGDARNIWADTPSSAELVYRFLEFRGVGPKIATMAANGLARDFKVPLKDYYSIDISVDVHVRRVFERLGFIEQGSTVERVVYRARA